jgi:uncharacterized protein YkwD
VDIKCKLDRNIIPYLFCFVALFTPGLAEPSGSASAAATVKENLAQPLSKEVRQQIARYRSARKPAQRAAAIVELAALGDEGKTSAKEMFAKELKLAEPAVRAAQRPTKFDAQLEKLRKVLADLRHDPNLSKDQLSKVGLPTLDELNAVYPQWTRAVAARTAKAAHLIEQLRQMVAVLKILQDKWPLDAPIPVNEYLAEAETQLGKLSNQDDEEARRVLAENHVRAAKFPADIRGGMDEVNALRTLCGLRPLAYDEKLCAAAAEHSSDMEKHNYFAHEAPTSEKKTPWDRAKLAGTMACGENIFKGANDAKGAIKGWFLSPGHHKNMLSESARRQGLGRSGSLWTQMFGG